MGTMEFNVRNPLRNLGREFFASRSGSIVPDSTSYNKQKFIGKHGMNNMMKPTHNLGSNMMKPLNFSNKIKNISSNTKMHGMLHNSKKNKWM
jgi:hypothetical protein